MKPSSAILTLVAITLATLLGCAQRTIEPSQTNNHLVRIETIKPTGSPAKNVQIGLYEDQTPGARQDFQGSTGDSAAVDIRLEIPTFGHAYLLTAQKLDAFGALLFSRPIYPLNLNCVDTVIRIVVPEADTAHPTDSLCGGQDASRTLTFYACADTTVRIAYTLKNCSAAAYTASASAIKAPFTISPSSAIIPSGGSQTFTLTYDGRGQTNDASTRVQITTSPNQGTATITLIGHLRHDCNSVTQNLICGVQGQSDSIRFGAVCQNTLTGSECVSFQNSNNTAITIAFPVAPAPFSYVVTDKNSASVNTTSSLTLAHGDVMTVCFSVNPPDVKDLSTSVDFPFTCPTGASAKFTVPLSAQVKQCQNCTCTDYFHDPINLTNNVRVGLDTTFNAEIFHNPLNCSVVVSDLTSDQGTAWSVLLPTVPALPATVPAGGSIQATLSFKPGKAGVSQSKVRYTITPVGSGATGCPGEVDLKGSGCNSACADVTMPPDFKGAPAPNDTLFFQQNGNAKIFVSVEGKTSSSDPECITLRYPDTACAAKAIAIVQPKSNLFSVSTTPSPLTLAPGQLGEICITFNAPLIDLVRSTFTKAGMELKFTDLLTIIDPDGCKKDVPLKAVVDTLPGCDQFTLQTYDATSAVVAQPFYEVWYYGGHAIRNPFRTPPTNGKPTTGDLYVLNNVAPELDIVGGGGRGLYHWVNPPFAELCSNKKLVTTATQTLIQTSPTFTSNLSLSVGEVILVNLGTGSYSVLLVNSITSAALTLDGISAVNFQLLYPIF